MCQDKPITVCILQKGTQTQCEEEANAVIYTPVLQGTELSFHWEDVGQSHFRPLRKRNSWKQREEIGNERGRRILLAKERTFCYLALPSD